MRRTNAQRRGVVLLVILGLLSLFMLVAVSYVMTTGASARGAKAAAKAEQAGDPFDALLKMAMLQVVRGPRNPLSAIGPYSLLEDLYGDRESIVGVIGADHSHGGALYSSAGPSTSTTTFGTPSFNPVTGALNGPTVLENSGRQIIELTNLVSFGWDRQPGFAGVNDDLPQNAHPMMRVAAANPVFVDDVGETGAQGSDDVLLQLHRLRGDLPGSVPRACTEGYFAGCVLTMLDGSGKKRSTRIIRWFEDRNVTPLFSAGTPLPDGSVSPVPVFPWRMWIEPFEDVPLGKNVADTRADAQVLKEQLLMLLGPGTRFVINGRPFNGSGNGYNSRLVNSNPAMRGLGDEVDPTLGALQAPWAFLPVPTTAAYRSYDQLPPGVTVYPASGGSMPHLRRPFDFNDSSRFLDWPDQDEDWDAPDLQNIHLAARMWNPAAARWQVRLPSYHRPALVNYWTRQRTVASWEQLPIDLRRRISFRPDPEDHWYDDQNGNGRWDGAEPWSDANGNSYPDAGEFVDANSNNRFDFAEPNWSGNLFFNAVNGGWDVDNDNDGDPDSVWIDLGAPLQTNARGQMVKPMFAILCLDLDGRLNINAHGSPMHYTFAAAPTSSTSAAMPADYFSAAYQPAQIPQIRAISDEAYVSGGTREHTDQTAAVGAGRPVSNPPSINGDTLLNEQYASAPFARHFTGGPLHWGGNFTATGGRWPPVGRGTVTNTYSWFSRGNLGTVLHEIGVGLGFGPADINLAPLLERPGAGPRGGGQGWRPIARINEYRWLLEGRYEFLANDKRQAAGDGHPGSSQIPPYPGRYGEINLVDPSTPGFPAGFPASALYMPRAGVTQQYNPSGAIMVPGDDTYPAAPGFVVGDGFRGFGDSGRIGEYGSPSDMMGQIIPGVDFRGQPYWAHLRHKRDRRPNDFVDDPYEINLFANAQRRIPIPNQTGGNDGKVTDIDQPFTPYELERVLRNQDVDRAWVDRFGNRIALCLRIEGGDGFGGGLRPDLRNRMTTEQWDIPVPAMTPTPEIRDALLVNNLAATNLTFADLVRGKLLSAAMPPLRAVLTGSSTLTSQAQIHLVNEQCALMVNSQVPTHWRPTLTSSATRDPMLRYARCFSPDLALGLRMDINRPWGNGVSDDDDNQDGLVTNAFVSGAQRDVVDDADEGYMQPLWRPAGSVPPTVYGSYHMLNGTPGGLFDANGDGIWDFLDTQARQEFAKHLYCLMMLMMDDMRLLWTEMPGGSPIQSRHSIDSYILDSSASVGERQRRTTMLIAYRVAQWAINVVDFRDRDAIMTPFEFDIYPFEDDDANRGAYPTTGAPGAEPYQIPGTWDVDGVLGVNYAISSSYSDDNAQPAAGQRVFRGLVWGMEHPDLLITETFAFHDKRVADTDRVKPNPPLPDPDKKTTDPMTTDPDYDQVRVPQGSLFIELYCTGRAPAVRNTTNDGDAFEAANLQQDDVLNYLPPELYDLTTPLAGRDVTGAVPRPASATDPNAKIMGALDLGRVVTHSTAALVSPVWRLAISAPHMGLDGQASAVTGGMRPTFLGPEVNRPSVREMAYNPGHTGDLNTAAAPNPRPAANIPGPMLPYYHPDIISFQPTQMNWLDQGLAPTAARNLPQMNVPLDRVVYFYDPGNGTKPLAYRSNTGTSDFVYHPIFRNQFTRAGSRYSTNTGGDKTRFLLPPGRYAVIGPARPVALTNSHPNNVGWNVTTMGRGLPNGSANPPRYTTNPGFPYYFNVETETSSFNFTSEWSSAVNQALHPLGIPIGKYLPTGRIGQPCDSNNDGKFTSADNIPQIQGLNISEPIEGYLSKFSPYNAASSRDGAGTSNAKQAVTYSSIANGGEVMVTLDRLDPPEDDPADALTEGGLLGQLKILQPGSYLDCRTVFLQRLADPTRPWNPEPQQIDQEQGNFHDSTRPTNPYITIDWLPIDLHIINGETVYDWLEPNVDPMAAGTPKGEIQKPEPRPQSSSPTYPSWPTAQTGPGVVPRNYWRFDPPGTGTPKITSTMAYAGTLRNGSRERGFRADDTGRRVPGRTALEDWNRREAPLWAAVSDDPWDKVSLYQTIGFMGGGLTPNEAVYILSNTPTNTLGRLNFSYCKPTTALTRATLTSGADDPGYAADYLGSAGGHDGNITPSTPKFQAETIPFPWLPWHNRPFANAMELLVVPSSSPGRLGIEYSHRTASPNDASLNRATSGTWHEAFGFLFENKTEPYFSLLNFNGTVTAGTAQVNPYTCRFVPWGTWSDGRAMDLGTSSNMRVSRPLRHAQYPPQVPGQQVPVFGHLLNFFASSPAVPSSTNSSAAVYDAQDSATNFFRIFEFIHVPSRFSGTAKPLIYDAVGVNPSLPVSEMTRRWFVTVTPSSPLPSAANPLTAPTNWLPSGSASSPAPLAPFYAPFNRLHRFREPGKVNLNTVFDRDSNRDSVGAPIIPTEMAPPRADMWRAITNYFPGSARTWFEIRRQRGDVLAWPVPGQTLNTPNYTSLDARYPELFPYPFRSYTAAGAVPTLVQRHDPNDMPLLQIDSSLLRRLPPVISPAVSEIPTGLDPRVPTSPLWRSLLTERDAWWDHSEAVVGETRQTTSLAIQQSVAQINQVGSYRDFYRNPYFRYQQLIKVGGSLTNRSNVYAMWVTVGYFEVEKIPPNAPALTANPGGYRLLREVGSETGDIERHRGFCIIDRSIPVGFLRGENLNVDKAFLIKRIIE